MIDFIDKFSPEEALKRAERERDELREQLHATTERMHNMSSAAVSAAQTTVTALERLQEYQEIIDAAAHWQDTRQTHYDAAEQVLWDLIAKWRTKRAKMT